MSDYHFHWVMALRDLPSLLQGAVVTLQLTILSMIIGVGVSVPLAVMRWQGRGVWSGVAGAWVDVARNTPVLLQVYAVYFGLGAYGFNISSYAATLLAISFNNIGYLIEIFRGGLATVPRYQYISGRSLGMSATQAYAYIVWPQLLRIVFYSVMTQMIWAMLNTSLGLLIGLRELAGAAEQAQSVNYRTLETFAMAALLYYLMAKLLILGAELLYARLYGRR
ncbi:amino acid ABC transporter permease [Gluconacetobacter asukensis]|uniref:Amino acid ABC transporter permease n=1 Tax=Gluconacetobacter asukensis TaxID=1017181 RepID=A0A7W4P194_9PROT|nr:amino acid ABC transporter permease [Gluconacetobacter asukensis]MBB2173727.1 amino acid ABC transporter permease [Gluconacetobacter asukensis]